MNCSACSARLGQRQDGELSPHEAALVDAHLASCAACRSLADRMAAAEAALVRLVPIAPSDDFTLAVMAKIAALPAHAQRPARFWWLLVADVAFWAALGALTAFGAIRWKLVAASAGSFTAKAGVTLATLYDVAHDLHLTTYVYLGAGIEIAFVAAVAYFGRRHLPRLRATLAGVLS